MSDAREAVFTLVRLMYKGLDFRIFYSEMISEYDFISPDDVFHAMNKLRIETGEAHGVIRYVDKVINMLQLKLARYNWEKPADGTFIRLMMDENKELLRLLEDYKKSVREQDKTSLKSNGTDIVDKIKGYNVQLLKLENILFAELEKRNEMFEGLSMLWDLHEKARKILKDMESLLKDNSTALDEINRMIGQLYFIYYGLVKKQEMLLFPASTAWIDEETFRSMQIQAYEYGFAFIDAPKIDDTSYEKVIETSNPENFLETETGALTLGQIEGILNNLPFDVTFVDERDEVAYFSEGEKRIFPRSKSAIGRKVQNCHPSASVHMVEKILAGFRKKRSDSETFWINLRDRLILIKYIAVRDREGNYIGTLEVTQDITDIKKLEGEKRLMDS